MVSMTLSGKTVFVTGASGLLGGALTRRLAKEGALVKALVRDTERDPSLRNIDGVELIQGDITDENRMYGVIQDCEFVFHPAGVLNGSLEFQRRVNVGGTRNIMKAAAKAGVERVVHVSSSGAYGFGRQGDITEDIPLEPGHAAYGISKAEGEDEVRKIGRELGVDYSIIRPGMIYGPGSSIWTVTMFKFARRKPTFFIGDGSGSIPLIYVDDLVDMMIVLAVHPAASRETFNCVFDPTPTWREFLGGYSALAGHDRWVAIPVGLLKIIARVVATFAPKETRFKDLPQLIEFITGHQRYPMDKARDRLGWQPKVNLNDGIKSCIPFLREKGLLSK